jgi:hypothetical protein
MASGVECSYHARSAANPANNASSANAATINEEFQ